MSKAAGQTPYEFARAFFSFLEARAVTVGDCSSHRPPDLRIPHPRTVTAGERGWTSCGLSADWERAARHACIDCGHPIPNGTAHTGSRLFEQVAWCEPCWTASAS
jgi:hypothetical protein